MPFADQLINESIALTLVRAFQRLLPNVELPNMESATGQLAELALRERADLLRDALLSDVPDDFAELARLVRLASADPDFRGWLIWPVTSAVAAKAVSENTDEVFDEAMALLAELTGLLTAEFAIRTLLRHDLGRALGHVREWATSEDSDVRRLASEGTRPYLPWSTRVPSIIAEPGVTIPVLDALYRDEEEYVRRSVANHLNDLSRDAPEIVIETARRWLAAPDQNTERLVRHGLRTLIKKGDVQALELLGFGPVSVDVIGPVLEGSTVKSGESLRFRASVRNLGTEPARLAIDYTVYHRKANGGQSGKTFKLASRTLGPNESLEVQREHSFRAITTRRYYAGLHGISVQVNGVESARTEFELLPED